MAGFEDTGHRRRHRDDEPDREHGESERAAAADRLGQPPPAASSIRRPSRASAPTRSRRSKASTRKAVDAQARRVVSQARAEVAIKERALRRQSVDPGRERRRDSIALDYEEFPRPGTTARDPGGAEADLRR